MLKVSPPQRVRSAFTLIELLVSISIIAILAALLLPAMGRARDSANRMGCQANLRKIFTGIQLYANDNGGVLPGPLRGGQPARYSKFGTQDDYLTTFLAPYLELPDTKGWGTGLAKVFLCPGWRQWKNNPNPPESARMYMAAQYNVKLIDGSLVQPFGYPGQASPVRLVQIANPSKVMALYDLDQLNATSYKGDSSVPAKPIHNGLRNILFFDGHVEVLKTMPATE